MTSSGLSNDPTKEPRNDDEVNDLRKKHCDVLYQTEEVDDEASCVEAIEIMEASLGVQESRETQSCERHEAPGPRVEREMCERAGDLTTTEGFAMFFTSSSVFNVVFHV